MASAAIGKEVPTHSRSESTQLDLGSDQSFHDSAQEEWLKAQQRSSLTNEAMGTKLLPALPIRNAIRTMVTSGALTGEMVDACKEKLAEEEDVEANHVRLVLQRNTGGHSRCTLTSSASDVGACLCFVGVEPFVGASLWQRRAVAGGTG